MHLILLFISCAISNDIILSAGIGGYNTADLLNIQSSFRSYAKMGIISKSSILAYNIDENGDLGTYMTSSKTISAEKIQQMVGSDINIKAMPCIYCDETQGMCSNLKSRLNKLYSHKEQFIKSTIDRAIKYGWNGYTIDFEPTTNPDPDVFTSFVIEWGNKLNKYNLKLDVWIGGCTSLNMTKLYNSNLKLITMDTYSEPYDEFIRTANLPLMQISNISNIGFGLSNGMIENKCFRHHNTNFTQNLEPIIEWSKVVQSYALSIWATVIPPSWFGALKTYSNI